MRSNTLSVLLRAHDVIVSTDDAFQRRARLLQAMWRVENKLAIGERSPGVPLGSRLPLDAARESAANFMTAGAKTAVTETLAERGSGKLIEEDRLFANLLSSQPLCFNLFGELRRDKELATRVMRVLYPGRVDAVESVQFEYSPGKSNPQYTGDRSAFDVFLEHTTPRGGRGFIGFEVKYHEGLNDDPSAHRPRYDEVAAGMECFRSDKRAALRDKPLQQLWRDHLLAGSMLSADADRWETGLYVFLHASGNTRCTRAVERYRECLSNTSTFDSLTIERLLDVLEACDAGDWVARVRDRYFGWSKIAR